MCFLFWQLGQICSPSLVSPLNHLNHPFLLFLHSLSRNLRLSTLSLFIWAHTLGISDQPTAVQGASLATNGSSESPCRPRSSWTHRQNPPRPRPLAGGQEFSDSEIQNGDGSKPMSSFIYFSCIFPINLEKFASIATDAAAIFGFTKVHQARGSMESAAITLRVN